MRTYNVRPIPDVFSLLCSLYSSQRTLTSDILNVFLEFMKRFSVGREYYTYPEFDSVSTHSEKSTIRKHGVHAVRHHGNLGMPEMKYLHIQSNQSATANHRSSLSSLHVFSKYHLLKKREPNNDIKTDEAMNLILT